MHNDFTYSFNSIQPGSNGKRTSADKTKTSQSQLQKFCTPINESR